MALVEARTLGLPFFPRGRRHGVSCIVEETAPLGESGESQGWVDGQTSDDEWYLNTLKSRLEAEFAKLCADSGAVRAVVQANVDLLVQGALE